MGPRTARATRHHSPRQGPDMNVGQSEEVAQMLVQLGLSADESNVFTTLTFLGTSRAGAVAAASKLSRAQAYRALELLAARGLVRTDLSRPRQFSAAPVQTLLSHLKAEIENQTQELRVLEPDLRKLLDVPQASRTSTTSRSDILRGRTTVAVRAVALYQAARRRVDVIFTHPGGIPLMDSMGSWTLILKRAQEGVRVRLIVGPRPDHATYYAEARAQKNIEIRERGGALLAAMVADEEDSLVVLVADPSSHPRSDRTVALTSDAPNLVSLLSESFEAMWTQAAPPGPLSVGAPSPPPPDRRPMGQGLAALGA